MNYGSVVAFKAYHTARAKDFATFSDAQILASLQVASEWIDATYRNSFSGLKIGQRDQIREWPRSGAVDYYGHVIANNAVPAEIENATYEAALKELQVEGALSVDYSPSKYKRASVDGALSVEFNSFASAQDVQTKFQVIDQILWPILTGTSAATFSAYSGMSVRA